MQNGRERCSPGVAARDRRARAQTTGSSVTSMSPGSMKQRVRGLLQLLPLPLPLTSPCRSPRRHRHQVAQPRTLLQLLTSPCRSPRPHRNRVAQPRTLLQLLPLPLSLTSPCQSPRPHRHQRHQAAQPSTLLQYLASHCRFPRHHRHQVAQPNTLLQLLPPPLALTSPCQLGRQRGPNA